MKKIRKSFIIGKIISYFVLGILFVIMVYPLFWVLMSSVKDNWTIFQNPTGLPSSPTFKNYQDAWVMGNFSLYFLNSIIITVFSLAGILLLSTMAGYGFARYKFRSSNIFLNLFIAGTVIVPSSIMISQYQLISSLGLLDTFLGIILVYLAWTTFGIIIFRLAFSQIPQELVDAAHIDGCGEFGIYLRILLPLIRPAVAAVGIFTFIGIWNDFIWPLVLLQQPGQETVILGLLTLRGQYLADWGILTACLSFAFAPVVVIYLIFQRHFVQGLGMGALKQ
ncbi:sugar ABC transporter permease [Candidatus Aerophobetes bacterium Ae_b3a]|nr:MAG: sugar ABC transporter permease [Candidatus Aerophobetes bacterium Ae_b3a]